MSVGQGDLVKEHHLLIWMLLMLDLIQTLCTRMGFTVQPPEPYQPANKLKGVVWGNASDYWIDTCRSHLVFLLECCAVDGGAGGWNSCCQLQMIVNFMKCVESDSRLQVDIL